MESRFYASMGAMTAHNEDVINDRIVLRQDQNNTYCALWSALNLSPLQVN